MEIHVEGECVNLCDDEDEFEVDVENNKEKDTDAGEDVDEIVVENSQLDGGSLKRIIDLTADDIRAMEFCSEEEACTFYSKYAQLRGFSARKDDLYRDAMGNVITRQLVCSKAGVRDEKHLKRKDRVKKPKPITRFDCKARFRVRHDISSKKWTVVHFSDDHSHELAAAEHVHLIPSYRGISDGDKAFVNSMKLSGVRTCNIMAVMLSQKGGHESVGFTSKDLANHLDREKRKRVQDGDSVAALSYLQGKCDIDPLFFFKFTKTEDGNLEHLFWCDGISRLDYNIFGDVIAFDSTYRKNKYNKPLVIFCGYNHHKQTTLFGAALVQDETIKSYTWVLQNFSEAMFDKHPVAILTDGCPSMREAIKVVFPNSTHTLCSWHIHQNCVDHMKDPEGLEELNALIYGVYTPQRFEEKWKNFVDNYSVKDEKWIKRLYDMKRYWASTFMKDKFFAGIRTTSLCEGVNSQLKRFLQCKCTLFDFLHNFERAVKEYRQNELKSDFTSSYTEPVTSDILSGIEEGAAKILTRKVFYEVKSEIDSANGINVIERAEVAGMVMLKMVKFPAPRNKRVFIVVHDISQNRFVCDCGFFEYCGLPCCHIIVGLKTENVNEFPSSLVSKRWLKNAKAGHVYSIPNVDLDSKKLAMLRKGSMTAACNILTELACDNVDDFDSVTAEIYKLVGRIQTRRNPGTNQNNSVFVVGDPTVVRGRGAPKKKKFGKKKKRCCSNCKLPGHTIKTCPTLYEIQETANVEGGESSVEIDESSTHDKGENARQMNSNIGSTSLNEPGIKRKAGGVTISSNNSQKLKKKFVSPTTPDSVNVLNNGKVKAYDNENIKREVHELGIQVGSGVAPNFWPSQYGMNFSPGVPMIPHFSPTPMFHPTYHSMSMSQGQSSGLPPKFMGMLKEVENKAKDKSNSGV